ncbi:hypothetical protein Tco_0137665 [Tanacetum coccineum]
MHERPARKIGLYTRFFDFANFRLPLSTFLVNILRHFCINISQLSVNRATKVSHFEILCRVYGITPTVGLFRCFYVNSKNNGWMSFSKRLINLTDPAPATADFNAHDYATLVAHPSPFWKFPEEFLCLVGLSRHYTLDEETYPWLLDKDGEDMDIFAFIHTLDPTKVKVVEPRLLETTVGRTVPLLPVAPDRTESELKASVDKLFDEGGSDVAPLHPRRQRKRKIVVVDAGEASHPPKKLREDHRTPSGASVGDKSRSAVQQLLAGAVLNAEVMGEPIPTLPFVTSFVSAMPGHSSHHSGTNVVEAEVDSLIRSSAPVMTTVTIVTPTVDTAAAAKEKLVEPSLFGAASSSAGGTDPTPGSFSDLTGSDFIVGGIRTVISPDTDLQKVYVPQWSVTNGSRLDDGRVCHKMVDEFAPPKFFASIRGMEHDQLFTEFNIKTARQMSLSAEVRMHVEYNIKEKRGLKSVAEDTETEAAEAIRLRVEASKFEAVEKSLQDKVKALKERNASLEKEQDALYVKVTGLEASAMGKDPPRCEFFFAFQKSNKDASVETVYEHTSDLKIPLVLEKLVINVSSSRVRKIKENVANHRSALHDVFVLMVKPLSVTALTDT